MVYIYKFLLIILFFIIWFLPAVFLLEYFDLFFSAIWLFLGWWVALWAIGFLINSDI